MKEKSASDLAFELKSNTVTVKEGNDNGAPVGPPCGGLR